MELDINTLRGLATVMVTTAFLGVCFWAYSGKRKTAFTEAANIPFADDDNDTDIKNIGEVNTAMSGGNDHE